MIKYTTLLLVLVTALGCKTDTSLSDMEDLSLLTYGVPITIKAPAGADVKKSNLGVFDDVTIKAGEDYYVQLLASDATLLDVALVKQDLLADIKASRYFSSIVEDFPDGFIYEKQIDSSNTNYSFRHVKIHGDKEYIFQTGLVGQYSIDDVKTMYRAVQ